MRCPNKVTHSLFNTLLECKEHRPAVVCHSWPSHKDLRTCSPTGCTYKQRDKVKNGAKERKDTPHLSSHCFPLLGCLFLPASLLLHGGESD